MFTQPPGRLLGNSKGQLTGNWGEVRGRNGVIVVEPTPHPDGREYRWLATGPVPELPAELAALLPDAMDAADAATDAEVAAFLAAHTAARRPGDLEDIIADLEKRLRAGAGRHDTARPKARPGSGSGDGPGKTTTGPWPSRSCPKLSGCPKTPA